MSAAEVAEMQQVHDELVDIIEVEQKVLDAAVMWRRAPRHMKDQVETVLTVATLAYEKAVAAQFRAEREPQCSH
jgi:hypothetical protein